MIWWPADMTAPASAARAATMPNRSTFRTTTPNTGPAMERNVAAVDGCGTAARTGTC